jgi:chaperone BCS1
MLLGRLGRARSLCTSTLASLAQNQVATGGFAVLAGGASLATLRTLGMQAWDLLLRRVVLHAEFDSRDDSYRWLVAWLAVHPHFQTTRRFSVVTTLRRLGASHLDDATAATDSEQPPPVTLIPIGTSMLRHRGRWLLVSREQRHSDRPASDGKERETLTLQLVGGTRADVVDLVAEARAAYMARERGWTSVHMVDEYGNWQRVGARPARRASSVVLGSADGVDELLADCRRFLRATAWYA